MTQFNQLLILATKGFETMGFSMIVADSIPLRHGIILSSKRFLEQVRGSYIDAYNHICNIALKYVLRYI